MKRPSGSSNNSLTVRISSLYGRIFLELPTRVGLCVIAFADPSVGIETNGEVKGIGVVLIRPSKRRNTRTAFQISFIQDQCPVTILSMSFGIGLEGVLIGERRIRMHPSVILILHQSA